MPVCRRQDTGDPPQVEISKIACEEPGGQEKRTKAPWPERVGLVNRLVRSGQLAIQPIIARQRAEPF